MPELSRRAYARFRGVSEAAIRKHITSGVLSAAILPNGLIDSAVADNLLAGTITRPKRTKTPVVLATAKRRRARATARDLLDEVRDLKGALVPPRPAQQFANTAFEPIAALARRWATEVPSSVAGRPADEVQRGLKTAVNDLLAEIQAHVIAEAETMSFGTPKAAPDVDAMTAVELAALIEHLRAEILELGRLERRRKLVRIIDAIAIHNEATTFAKSVLLAIPGRLDVFIASADVAEAERLLSAQVEAFIAAARVDLSPLLKEQA